MQLFVEIEGASIDELLQFYTKDLPFFEFYGDYGMQTLKLINRRGNFGLILKENTSHSAINKNLFFLNVDCIESIFSKLQKSSNFKGTLITKEIFEWPGGKSISIMDPAGNKFLVTEEHLFY